MSVLVSDFLYFFFFSRGLLETERICSIWDQISLLAEKTIFQTEFDVEGSKDEVGKFLTVKWREKSAKCIYSP